MSDERSDLPAQDLRLPSVLQYAYNVRSTYRPPERIREFGSVAVRRKLFTPPGNAFGPRTINRGPDLHPTGTTVPLGAFRKAK